MMGTSVLAMPWAFAEAGLAAAILLCLINGPVAAFTAILVDRLHKKASISTLHQDDSLYTVFSFPEITDIFLPF